MISVPVGVHLYRNSQHLSRYFYYTVLKVKSKFVEENQNIQLRLHMIMLEIVILKSCGETTGMIIITLLIEIFNQYDSDYNVTVLVLKKEFSLKFSWKNK